MSRDKQRSMQQTEFGLSSPRGIPEGSLVCTLPVILATALTYFGPCVSDICTYAAGLPEKDFSLEYDSVTRIW